MQPVYLIGFMGAGKTTIGQALSAALGCPVYDLDKLIEVKENMSIPEIFSRRGENYFRKKETEILEETAGLKGIVATGGGIVQNKGNRNWLREHGLSIFLKCPPETAVNRIMGDKNRPLAAERSFSELASLYYDRVPFYEESSHITIDTSKKAMEETVREIMDCLKARGIGYTTE